jgi:hypothetical protein
MASPPPTPPIPGAPAGIAFAYDTATQRLSDQLAQIDGIDTKIGVVAAAIGVAIGLLFSGTPELWIKVVLGVLLGGSFVSAALAFYGGRVQYLNAPDPNSVTLFNTLAEEVIKTLFIANVIAAFNLNQERLDDKVRFFKIALVLLAVGAIFAIAVRVAGKV